MLLFRVNLGPIASFQYSPSPPIVGHFTVFDASASVSLYGPITNYQWHFSDGSTASGITLTHKFSNAGTYNASLTVTDVTGENDTVQEPIYVSDHDYLPGVSPGTTASYTLTVAYSNSSLALSADLKVTVTRVIGSNVTYGTGVFKQGIQTSSRLASIDVSREANPNLLPPFFTIASGLNVGEPIYP